MSLGSSKGLKALGDDLVLMSLSSFRIDRADLASTASDRCSEDSFGVVGSVEDRLKTDRSSKLAAFKERQVKNFQRPPIASVASTSS